MIIVELSAIIMIIVKLSAVEQCLLVCPPIDESCPMTVIYQ